MRHRRRRSLLAAVSSALSPPNLLFSSSSKRQVAACSLRLRSIESSLPTSRFAADFQRPDRRSRCLPSRSPAASSPAVVHPQSTVVVRHWRSNAVDAGVGSVVASAVRRRERHSAVSVHPKIGFAQFQGWESILM
ncbi:hypothetical protein AAHA92_17864 [Salvia divinorum]|uniref:Uncharacterized protein n=1 Tax=Salvia divinorum TaxID=28513 RepID=A0ABD1H3Q4_SALDI